MADQRGGGISWTEETWNPIRGCTRVSEGCRNCYAETVAARFSDPGQPYHGLATRTPSGPRWTGQVVMVPDHLTDPLRWRRPRLIFVNSMSDLFHDGLTFEQIDQVMAVMVLARRHTFQVLTKRPDRMAAYLQQARERLGLLPGARTVLGGMSDMFTDDGRMAKLPARVPDPEVWPRPNIWWGTSAEDQKTLDARMPALIRMREHAAVLWLSAEPLLGAMNLRMWLPHEWETSQTRSEFYPGLDWVVVGGESGVDARPMNPAWARAMRNACRDAGVPFHFKQWGEYGPAGVQTSPAVTDLEVWDPGPNRKGFQARATWPGGEVMRRVGKKAAGRLLDGVMHDAMPIVSEWVALQFPNMRGRSRSLADRFWEKVSKTDGCWFWTGAVGAGGYGMFRINPKKARVAHGVAWELTNGKVVPEGKILCHTCDTPLCVRPDHVYPGTRKDNMRDMIQRGRWKRPPAVGFRSGEAHHFTTLTQVQVDDIRASSELNVVLAERYGVSRGTIYRIRSGITWRENVQQK